LTPENACGDIKQDPSRHWFGSATTIHAIAAKAIADHRFWLTEHLKGVVSGLLGYASGLVSAGLRADDQNRGRNAAAQQGTGHQDQMQDTAASAATATAQMFRAMSDHWLSNLDYARRLAEVTSAAELILLSTRQAREQVDLLLEQVAAFQALTRSIISGVDRDRPQGPD
jgi:BMFP domain-containing protein YqiC